MNKLIYTVMMLALLSACSSKESKPQEKDSMPVVSNDGQTIAFSDRESAALFKTDRVSNGNVTADLAAPGKISATILPSGEGDAQHIVLFENPELAGNYTQLIQHRINITQIQNINIRQKQLELSRIKDLNQHGAATGQDLLNVQTALSMEQTNLANERAAMIEHESRLVSAGFDPDMLRKAKVGTAYVICDIPENQVSKIQAGNTCKIRFTAFPDETFNGRIDHIAEVVDNVTRMVKLRISLDNSNSKLKAGMFAMVSFGLSEGNFITISKNALVTVQGENYVFVKTGDNTFRRVKIEPGQQIGDKVVVFSGLQNGDEIATEGVMQLKGLSFGY